jgi:ribonuclease HI
MEQTMRTVDLFVTTSLRGSAKGPGRVMYVLRTTLKSGKVHESIPEVAEYDDVSERKLILLAARDALTHMNFACMIVLHTECDYITSVLCQGWLARWQQNGWKNSRDKEVKDACLWSMLLQDLEEDGHVLTAVTEKHEFVDWMRWKMQVAQPYKNMFAKLDEKPDWQQG